MNENTTNNTTYNTNVVRVTISLNPKTIELIDEMAEKNLQNRSAFLTSLVLKEARERNLYKD